LYNLSKKLTTKLVSMTFLLSAHHTYHSPDYSLTRQISLGSLP
jgi:hypothetical protein